MYDKIKEKAKKFLNYSKNSHNLDHTERVYKLCMQIGKKEKADLKILQYASLLHDIGRKYENRSKGKKCHAAIGGKLARKILCKLKMDETKIDKIVYCIETHRFRGDKRPESLEAKILFDADKLDAIGAVGIGRAFQFAGEVGAKLHDKDVDTEKTRSYTLEDTAYREYLVKLRFIKDKLLTRTGKKIAAGRHKFMEQFFKQINKEVEGEC